MTFATPTVEWALVGEIEEERGGEMRKGEGRTGQEGEGKKRKGGGHTSYLFCETNTS